MNQALLWNMYMCYKYIYLLIKDRLIHLPIVITCEDLPNYEYFIFLFIMIELALEA